MGSVAGGADWGIPGVGVSLCFWAGEMLEQSEFSQLLGGIFQKNNIFDLFIVADHRREGHALDRLVSVVANPKGVAAPAVKNFFLIEVQGVGEARAGEWPIGVKGTFSVEREGRAASHGGLFEYGKLTPRG